MKQTERDMAVILMEVAMAQVNNPNRHPDYLKPIVDGMRKRSDRLKKGGKK